MSKDDYERAEEIGLKYNEEYEAAHNVELQLDAWNEFAMTGKSSALAKYLSLDGEFDDDVRKMVIKILKDGPFSQQGGADLWRDYKTYLEIRSIMRQRDCTLRNARDLFRDQTSQELRTVEKQYQRADTFLRISKE